MTLGHRSRYPGLEKSATNTLARFEASYAGTDGSHNARAIGERDQVAGDRTAEEFPVTTI
jgi:hypothetical protein